MSQQEFEPRGPRSENEIYQPHYPYNWSDQHEEGMPRDEPPGAYDAPAGQPRQTGYQPYQTGQAQVPWWARPQPQQNGPRTFAALVTLAVLIIVLMGALGIIGVILGSLAHLIGILLGAIFALLIFVFLVVLFIIALVWRAIGRAFGYNRHAWHDMRRAQRRASHDARRMARRAARRYRY